MSFDETANPVLKYTTLILLTAQNALLVILLHYSQTRATPYSSATAVLVLEVLKGVVSLVLAIITTPAINTAYLPITTTEGEEQTSSPTSRIQVVCSQICSKDAIKLSIPAILYVVQNNLSFVAGRNLSPAEFQVTYQAKILTTALFSVVLLNRRLSGQKWASLVALTIGVAVVQLQRAQTENSGAATAGMNQTKGLVAVMIACTTSGLAGVYFEKVLKTSTTSVWVRNFQLSAFSIIPAFLPAFFPQSRIFSLFAVDELSAHPPRLFSGFSYWTWAVIATEVAGGLLTALVIKYSNAIIKNFATSLSICLSFAAGVYLFGYRFSPAFEIGALTVLIATYTYNFSWTSENDSKPPTIETREKPPAPA